MDVARANGPVTAVSVDTTAVGPANTPNNAPDTGQANATPSATSRNYYYCVHYPPLSMKIVPT